jgi:hypothetical protein
MTTAAPEDRGFSIRSVIPTLVFDVLAPYTTYALVKAYVPSATEVGALGASALGEKADAEAAAAAATVAGDPQAAAPGR